MTVFRMKVERRIACPEEGYPQSEALYDSIEDYQAGYEDSMAHSVVEGRTAQFSAYRRLSSSGYKKRLSELLRDQYNPLKVEVESTCV